MKIMKTKSYLVHNELGEVCPTQVVHLSAVGPGNPYIPPVYILCFLFSPLWLAQLRKQALHVSMTLGEAYGQAKLCSALSEGIDQEVRVFGGNGGVKGWSPGAHVLPAGMPLLGPVL